MAPKQTATGVNPPTQGQSKQWKTDELHSLFLSSRFLQDDVKEKLGLLMPVDVYVQDPYVAGQNQSLALSTITVSCEPELANGPTSARIAVVDYDGDTAKLENPAQWDEKKRRFVIGRKGAQEPISRKHCEEPQFRQLNAWAIIQKVLDIYEATWVLGRPAPWAFEGNRLIVVPCAGYLANAFYDRSSKSVQFYYCGPKAKRVYTCLSHDIITHETGHAILDGLRPRYGEDSSLQTTAFHEFVADLTAIMTSLLNNELRWEVAEESVGDLTRDTIVSSLAEEFGRYATGRPFLRSAQNKKTIRQVETSRSPYDWSEVLTGTMFDILTGMVAARFAKAKKGGTLPTPKEALSFAVNRFRRVALQSLDYLPPVDVQFRDYAEAVLRADQVAEPVDEDGYRVLMRKCFAKRGIACPAEGEEQDTPHFYAYDINRLSNSRTDAYHFINENRRQLCIPAEQDVSVFDLYQTDKTVGGGGGKLPREVVLQYGWREDVELKGSDFGALEGERVSLLCGGTLIFDGRGNLLSWMRKPGAEKQEASRTRRRRYCDEEMAEGERRRLALLAYMKSRVDQGALGLVDSERPGSIAGEKAPVTVNRREDGTVRLVVTPHLRHWTEDARRAR